MDRILRQVPPREQQYLAVDVTFWAELRMEVRGARGGMLS